jgi:hypothetical protein
MILIFFMLSLRVIMQHGSLLASAAAPAELQAIVLSWGDTMEDEETLRDIRAYNRSGTIFAKVIRKV